MRARTVAFLLCLLALTVVSAQETKVKKVPAKHTSAASGQEMYNAYCASCHGTDGKGNGPAAAAMKTATTDLTQLAAKNGGTFPELKVYAAIKGGSALVAHGSKDMPVWGPIFRSVSAGRESETHMRLVNLTNYVRSLQAK
jgi:mono/diheme cytochrome c family protein